MSFLIFNRCSLLALSLFSILISHRAFSLETSENSNGDSPKWGIGFGVTLLEPAYIDSDIKTMPFPLLSYEGKHFRFLGNTADLKYDTPEGKWSFALRGRYSLGSGYKENDAPILHGMADRKDDFWLGGAITWNSNFARISADVLRDISDESDGVQSKLNVERDFHAGSFLFTPHISAQYMDKKFINYYYGVMPSEITSFRPGFEGNATVNVQTGLRATYNFNSKNSLILDITNVFLGKEITNSPLVDKTTIPSVSIGYFYHF